MTTWITETIKSAGYFGIIVLMVVENVFPPIPSELIMPLAGYLVSQEQLSMIGVVAAGTIGSVLGALPLYWIGHRYGADRLRGFVDRHGRWLAVSCEDLDKAQSWFDRHGGLAVFLCRLVPGVRSLISIPAGLAHMGMVKFLAFTTIGTAIWSAILAGAGYALGSQFGQVSNALDPVSYAVIGLIVVAHLWRVIRFRRSGHGRHATAD